MKMKIKIIFLFYLFFKIYLEYFLQNKLTQQAIEDEVKKKEKEDLERYEIELNNLKSL